MAEDTRGWKLKFDRNWVTVGGPREYTNKFYLNPGLYYFPRWFLETGVRVYKSRRDVKIIINDVGEKIITLPFRHSIIAFDRNLYSVETYHWNTDIIKIIKDGHIYDAVINLDHEWHIVFDDKSDYIHEWEFRTHRRIICGK